MLDLLPFRRLNGLSKKIAEGDAARDRKDWPAAAEAYSKALAKDTANWPIWVQYGHALKESGQIAEAEAAYRRALSIAPQVADTHLQLGHALKLQKDTAGASAAYLQAARLDPQSPHARDELRSLGWTAEEILDDVSPIKPGEAHSERIAESRPATGPGLLGNPGAFQAKNYLNLFADVQELISLGIIDTAEQHYLHYGYRGGRDILTSLASSPPSRAFVLCPSFFKRCGIAEHSRYLADCIEASGLETHRVRTTAELKDFAAEKLRDSVVIVNHGPGLFDGYNPELSEGEATTDVIANLSSFFRRHNARPITFMHSLLDRDNREMFPRQQLWLESPIPIVTTIEAASAVFNILRVEHGMQPTPMPRLEERAARARDYPTIGFFGFFQWGGKNFDALFNVVQRLKGKLVGSVATGNLQDVEKLKQLIEEKGIRCDLGTGWVEDHELAQRLSEADYYYLPQLDYDHWNNSGTARLVMNFRRPVVLPPANPFLDLRDYAIFANENDLPALMAYMRDPKVYASACARAADYAHTHPMTKEMPVLARSLHEVASRTGAKNFIDDQLFCAAQLVAAPYPVFLARVARKIGNRGAQRAASPADGAGLEAEARSNPGASPPPFGALRDGLPGRSRGSVLAGPLSARGLPVPDDGGLFRQRFPLPVEARAEFQRHEAVFCAARREHKCGIGGGRSRARSPGASRRACRPQAGAGIRCPAADLPRGSRSGPRLSRRT